MGRLLKKIGKILRSKLFVRPLVAGCIALGLTNFLATDVNSDLVISVICGTSDIEVSDFYNRIRAGGSQKSIDNDIMIVNIDSVFGRDEIALLLNQISSGNPKAICLDVLLEKEKEPESDALLAQTLESTPNLVVSQRYNDFDAAPSNDFVARHAPDVKRGMTNLTSSTDHGMVRDITPFFGQNREYPGLGAEILSLVAPGDFVRLKAREGDEMIRFSKNEFYVAEPDEVWKNPEELEGKIVFVGTINEEGDLHPTAISQNYPGVMIHANVLSMMMHEDYSSPDSDIYNILLAVISCLIISVLYVYLDAAQNFVVRVFPIIWIALVAVAGCWLFNFTGIYINAPKTMLVAFLSIVVLDTWYAFEAPVKKLFNKIIPTKKLEII